MLQANCPHGSAASSSLTHGCSFRSLATAEQLPSPKRPPVGPTAAPPRCQTLSLCLWVWVALVEPETAWDFHRSVWTAIVSRRDHQSPRRTAAANRNVCCGRILMDPHVLQQVRELGTPSRPKRDPSQTILAWPLRYRPLLDDTGCIPLRRRGRARNSARARPRAGRIRSIGVGSIAPFMTEPTTPAAHA